MALNTNARIGGSGALLQLGATSVTSLTTTEVDSTTGWTTIAQINSFSPSLECAEVDVTSLNSGISREFIPGHLSATLSFSGNLVQSQSTATVDFNNTTNGLLTVYQARQTRAWKIIMPIAATAVATTTDATMGWGIVGFITNLTANADNGDNAMTIDGTIRVSDSLIVDEIVG